jgi:MFS family permease
MTAGFFLAMGVSALPVGALLDRYGPRRVQAPLLLVATAGLLIFAVGRDYCILMLGRILIGVGLAVAMTGAVKAIVTWFRQEQLPMVTGWMLACGSLGAVMASGPSDLLVQWIGWRHIFRIGGLYSRRFCRRLACGSRSRVDSQAFWLA